MSKKFLKAIVAVPAALGAATFIAGSALAQELPSAASPTDSLNQINKYGSEGVADQGQVTSVSQLSDVQPTDWAFQALQSLVERYGCIAGYPNRTYRGNRAMTRYEFAAGLNACMDRVNELIASATADLVKKEDLNALKKLQEDFAAELATLRGRVDSLEARTKTLEAQQFSTTTKLAGEVIFQLAAAGTTEGSNNNNQTQFLNRVRLQLNTSTNGKDLLVTRLASGNSGFFSGTQGPLTGEGRLTTQLSTGNNVAVDWLAYYFPVGKKLNFYVAAVGGLHVDYVAGTANPFIEDFGGGSGGLTFFSQSNSIYNIGGGSGVGITYKPNKSLAFNAGYLAGGQGNSAASPVDKNGLFNGSYAALFQVTGTPQKLGGKLQVAGTFVQGYHATGDNIFNAYGSAAVGTELANNGGFGGLPVPASTTSGGVSISYKFTPKFVTSIWGSYTNADYKQAAVADGEIWSYALALAFPDLGAKGNLGGIVVGAQPYLANAGELVAGSENRVPLQVEAFYKLQLNNYISVTPGIVYITNQGQSSTNGDVVIGTVRTTFKF
jgi:hypothetical protein